MECHGPLPAETLIGLAWGLIWLAVHQHGLGAEAAMFCALAALLVLMMLPVFSQKRQGLSLAVTSRKCGRRRHRAQARCSRAH